MTIIATYVAFGALLTNGSKSMSGVCAPTTMALVLSNSIGGVFGVVMMYFAWDRKSHEYQNTLEPDFTSQKRSLLAKEYKDFPLFRTPQVFINNLSQQLPILLLSYYFGAKTAGHYSIVMMALGLPVGLVGGAVYSVLYPQISESVSKGNNVKEFIVKATKGMLLAGLFPLLLVVIFGPTLFSWVFGAEWERAGIYAQWLAPWMFLQYANKPAVAAIPALRLQGGLLTYEIFSTGSKILALWLGFVLFRDDVIAIALFSVFGVISYLWLISWVIKCSDAATGGYEETKTS